MDWVTYQQPARDAFPDGGGLSPSWVGGPAVQQGPREAVQPPPLEVFKNLTKSRVTWSGLLAHPVLSTGWIGWTPVLPSNLNCLTIQTTEYEKGGGSGGRGSGKKEELIKIYCSKIQW